MKKIILASGSPRRKELMSLAGFDFEIITSDVDETLPNDILPDKAVELLSQKKCLDVFENHKDCIVIGADTVVSIDKKILGKPSDEEDAFEMLSMLSDKVHSVFTGVTIAYNDEVVTFSEETKVKFFNLSKSEISEYIKTKEPMDKAGSYGIQGLGGMLVEKIDGDYNNVVGLPISKLSRILKNIISNN